MPELTFTLGIAASLVTIIAGSLSVIRYLGRSRVIEEAAYRLGVDLYDLSGGLEETLAREPPMKVMEDLQVLARDGDVYTPEMLVTAAGNVAPPNELIEEAFLGENIGRTELLGMHLNDDELKTLVDDRDLWPDPIDRVVQLRDDSSISYAWLLSDDATEEDRASLASEIEQTFIEEKAGEPEALHFIVRNVDDLRELEAGTVEDYVKPWLRRNGEENN